MIKFAVGGTVLGGSFLCCAHIENENRQKNRLEDRQKIVDKGYWKERDRSYTSFFDDEIHIVKGKIHYYEKDDIDRWKGEIELIKEWKKKPLLSRWYYNDPLPKNSYVFG